MLAVAAGTASTTTTWLDPVVIGLIALSTFYGFMRGLLRSIAGVVGLVLAAIFAGRLAAYVDPALNDAHIQHPSTNGAAAFVIAFIAIVVVVEVAANLLRFVEKIMLLGWVDRFGGALFGLFRGVLLSMILLAGFAVYGSKDFNATLKQTTVAVWLWQNAAANTGMLPAGMRQSIIRLVNNQAPFTSQVSHLP
ncbi:MAG TPA: CvpA family protein [Chloroflexota bacterium]|nr:CvpA family protein [Chloroflexota bacterium]